MLNFMAMLQEFRTPFLNKVVELITITAEETLIIVVMCIGCKIEKNAKRNRSILF